MPSNLPIIILASACIALNVAAGTLVYLLKLPLYVDSAGIMLAAILVPGTRRVASLVSAIVAIVSFIVFGMLVSPFQPWFIGTGIAGALYGSLVVRGRVNDLIEGRATTRQFIAKLLLFGIGWGIVAAVVSAPVVVYLFGGVTGAGTTLIFAFLVKTGHQLVNAALLTGFSAEPIDKTLSLLLAIVIARFTPCVSCFVSGSQIMPRIRYIFPVLYIAFLLPAAPGSPIEAKIVALVTSSILAFAINVRSIIRIVLLLLTALCTLVPFLFLVQSAVCSSLTNPLPGAFLPCVMQRSLAVLLNVGLLSSVFLLATANEWRGSLVATINGMFLPRSVRMMAIVAGAMIGEFRRAMIRVHHAFTACGKAMPSANWRNVIVFPAMLGAVWASVLDGVVERIRGQWSSDLFWARYVPQGLKADARVAFSDLVVLGASGLVIASFFVKFSVIVSFFATFRL